MRVGNSAFAAFWQNVVVAPLVGRKKTYPDLDVSAANRTFLDSKGPDSKSFLLEAYKKHATELTSIEDRLNRLLVLILGIFGAGVTAIQKAKPVPLLLGTILIVAVFLFTVVAVHYNKEIHSLRGAVRNLLVRCETAMGFYTRDVFLQADLLYTPDERTYPRKGRYLAWFTAMLIIAAAIGLIVVIWFCSFGAGHGTSSSFDDFARAVSALRLSHRNS